MPVVPHDPAYPASRHARRLARHRRSAMARRLPSPLSCPPSAVAHGRLVLTSTARPRAARALSTARHLRLFRETTRIQTSAALLRARRAICGGGRRAFTAVTVLYKHNALYALHSTHQQYDFKPLQSGGVRFLRARRLTQRNKCLKAPKHPALIITCVFVQCARAPPPLTASTKRREQEF